jgi:hypothetical protein
MNIPSGQKIQPTNIEPFGPTVFYNNPSQKNQDGSADTYSGNRLAALNSNYIEKISRYNWMAIVIVITLGLLLILIMVQRFLTFIPSAIIDLLIAALLASSGIYIIWIVVDITNRDNMNFRELSIKDPPLPINLLNTKTALSSHESQVSGSTLNGNDGACIGKACCAVNDYWDTTNIKCSSDTPTIYKDGASATYNNLNDASASTSTNYNSQRYQCLDTTKIYTKKTINGDITYSCA